MSLEKSLGRRGFTLIELLVSIAIIASLMGMTSVAIYKAIRNARQAKIKVEIDQLAQALAGYKEKRLNYPPCMGGGPLTTTRQTLFTRHMSVAWPNMGTGNTYAAAKTAAQSYNYLLNGSVQTLDLDTLDAAEALVFWLGGFPTPVNPNNNNMPVAPTKLFGFHRDANAPFKRDAADITLTADAMRFRTQSSSFQFDQNRLVDNDFDGWLEYIPVSPTMNDMTAPYVYFDSGTYGYLTTAAPALSFPRYPNPATSNDGATRMMNRFGSLMPMALKLGSNSAGATTVQWANPNGIQLFAAGLDGNYAGVGGLPLVNPRIPTFPNTANRNGELYAIGGGQFTDPPVVTTPFMTEWERDNLSNMSAKAMDDARTEAQQ